MFEKNSLLAKPFIPWLLIGLGALIWAGTLWIWIQDRTPGLLRNDLMKVTPVFLWIVFIGLILTLIMNWDLLKKTFNHIPCSHWIGLAVTCGFAFYLVRGLAPTTHRLYYDEDIYQAIGLNIAQNNNASMTHDGRWEHGWFKSFRNEYNKQPNGWPFLLNLAYRLFGVSEQVSFTLTQVLFIAAIFLVFICGALLFESSMAGLLAAFIYALIPENVLWFSTVSVEPSTACASLFAMAATLIFFKTRQFKVLMLSVFAWAFAIQFRPEVILVLVLIGTLFYVDGWDELQKPPVYTALLLLAVLLSAHWTHLYVMRGESWGSSGDKLSLQYFANNFKTNSIYYFDSQRFPLLFTLFALIGSVMPGLWKSRFYAVTWFLLAWGIFLFFYAGSYQYGADVRFSLLSMAPLALLAGRGVWELLLIIRRRLGPLPTVFAFIVLGFNLAAYGPLMRAVGEEAWPSREDHKAAEHFATLIPSDGIIITHNPNMFQMMGKNAAQMSLYTEDLNYASSSIQSKFNNKVYLHWNYWCNTPSPVQNNFCENMLTKFDTELLEEWDGRGPRLAIYRVRGPKAASSVSPNKFGQQSSRQE